jgi:hypothetical protein
MGMSAPVRVQSAICSLNMTYMGKRTEKFRPAHDLHRPLETLDFAPVLVHKLSGEDVCPELIALAEGNLKVDGDGFSTALLEVVESVVVNLRRR